MALERGAVALQDPLGHLGWGKPQALLALVRAGVVHQHIGDADAQHGHEHVEVVEGLHHGGTEAPRQGPLLHGHDPADAAGHRRNQGLVEGTQEAGIDHGGPHAALLQQPGGGHGGSHHRAIGHDQQVVAIAEHLTAADFQLFPALFGQGHAFAFTPGNPQGTGAVVVDGGDEHALQLGLILGCHHGEVGHGAQVTDVVLALVGGAIGTHNSGPIEHEGDGQLLDAHVVDQLVVGALQEGAVDRHHGAQALTGHARRHGHGVLFGDTDIEILLRQGLLEQVQARAGGHGGGDAHHPGILFAELHQGLAKHLAVAGWLRLAGGVGLAGGQVEGRLGVVAHLVGFGIGIALALGGGHVHEHRPLTAVGGLEGAHHLADVVAIDRADVGETQLLKHRAHLGHGQAAHAVLEALQFHGQFAVQEGEMLHRLFGAAGEELHRRTEPHAVQVGGQGPHRR